jgi:predicted dehydrogenase
MPRLSRRSLIQAAAASTVFPLFTVAGTKASAKVVGANDRVRVGVVGINGRGQSHIDGFGQASQTEIACLVDVDSNLYKSRTERVKKVSGSDKGPNCVKDVREALDDKSLDVISIATPNHWHSLMTIWACQAGKDVYVEKPISHNLFEGRKCVEAAAKYKRVVQHGTQNRSSEGKAREIAAVHSGNYGKLVVSKGYCCKPRWSIGFKPIETPPETLDFNLWLGPAPEQPFHRNLVHYNWHWFWDTGNGDIGNQGVHEMDIARWAIKGATLPTKVWSAGGRYVPDGPDQGQTPNMQLAVMEFGDVLLVFETRGLVGKNKDYPSQVTNEYYTTEGVIKGGKFYKKGSDEGESLKVDDNDKISVIAGGPFNSFLKCVRERTLQTNCDAEVAHYSSALCHLANAAYRVGKLGTLEEGKKALPKGPQVAEAFEKINANCNAVDLPIKGASLTIGKSLTFDPAKEKFVNDDAANKLITRVYRPPFVVPESV